MPVSPLYQPQPVHLELGNEFYDEVEPASFPAQILRYRNQKWAGRIGLGNLTESEWIQHFAYFRALPANLPTPLALRYHGHQFQSYNPELGDGRGFLFAQLLDPQSEKILDLGTKGSGRTPYSRGGDGRLTLKGAVREILATERLEALGVNTSKTFSVIETGEALQRNDEPSPTRSAVLVRLSHSHIRLGTFQRFAYLGEKENLSRLLKHSVKYYFPHLEDFSEQELVPAFLKEVVLRTSELCAQWMAAGFVHGVLNSDNLIITGESFDYGPYRWLPYYDPLFTAAYFDTTGLYSYGRQPQAVLWNLHQFAMALSLLHSEPKELSKALDLFSPHFYKTWSELHIQRLGLFPRSDSENEQFLVQTFKFLEATKVPFDEFYWDWRGGAARRDSAQHSERASYYQGAEYEEWLKALGPFKICEEELTPPPHLRIEEIERIWSAIEQNDDWTLFNKKLEELRNAANPMRINQKKEFSV